MTLPPMDNTLIIALGTLLVASGLFLLWNGPEKLKKIWMAYRMRKEMKELDELNEFVEDLMEDIEGRKD